ncbi:putative transcription factor C2H2 family [Helianthus debilis subsp. tardiflorus]
MGNSMDLTKHTIFMWIMTAFIIIFFFFLVYYFSKQCQHMTEDTNNHVHERRGLDDTLLKTIGVIQFDPKSFKDGLQCAVCLSDVKEGDKIRVLPKCDHAFHMECVDLWFKSHSTCPICRNPVVDQPEIAVELQDYN